MPTLLEVSAFLLLSAAGGLGLLLVSAALVDRLAGRQAGIGARGFSRLGHAFLLALSLALLSVIAAEMVALRSEEPAVSGYARALLGDAYGPIFWSQVVILFVVAAILWGKASRRKRGASWVVFSGALVQVAVFLHHYLLLVAWQTHGLAMPYRPGSYLPTWIECAVVLGIVALCLLLLLPSVRLIPFEPLVFSSEPAADRQPDRRRSFLTQLWFVDGLVIAVVGLALSARVGTEPFQDPVFVGSPVVFIVGLAILATTGAVYELLP